MKKTRRQALLTIAGLGLGVAIAPSIIFKSEKKYKILIKNGKVFTKTGFQNISLYITHDGKIKIDNTLGGAELEIDAANKIVSPGFIDILGDNSSYPEKTYKTFEKYKLTDGVTTVLQMHGGSGNPKQFYQHFEKLPHYTNFGVSTKVMVVRQAYATLAARYKAVEDSVQAGALGVSHSIEYQPTPYDEIVGYAKIAKKYDRPFCLHLRYSSKEKELEGVKEAIKIAQATGVRLHIAHLHSTGGTFYMEKALDLIQEANDKGLEITTCIYPYTYWATYLHSKRFDEGWRQMYGLDYKDLTVVGSGEKLTKASFDAYRKRFGILVAVPEGTMPPEKTIDLALQRDFCMIGSDGGIESEPRANSHPRGAGCFATAIHHGQKIGISLENMLKKVSTLPANLLRPALNKRGVIEEGAIADITIFDATKINGKATVANPNQFSLGIENVILNGNVVYQNAKILDSKGGVIKN